ncbi:MAG: hypothetical protein MMC33_005686 [Icmadophila ericetorum]|nr:hypothetical protein [Icmadophila ericetorum]
MGDSYRPPTGRQDSWAPGIPQHSPIVDSYRPVDRYDAPTMCQNMYQFNGLQPPINGSSSNPQNHFSFQVNGAVPQYPQNTQQSLPPHPFNHSNQGSRPSKRHQHNHPGAARHGRDGKNWRERTHDKIPASERPLLRFRRGATPEQMPGMNNNQATGKRFLDANDLSDSEEEAMEVSDVEDGPSHHDSLMHDGNVSNAREDDHNLVSDGQPSQVIEGEKRMEKPINKWSNPEIFTALPPPDLAQRKKKNVVKLIRKATIMPQIEKRSFSQVAANDDFISFNFGDDDTESDSDHRGSNFRNGQGQGVPGAPSGPGARRIAVPVGPKERFNDMDVPSAPRSFSHLQKMTSNGANTTAAPGSPYSSTNIAGPSFEQAVDPNNARNPNPSHMGNTQHKRKFDDADWAPKRGRQPPQKKPKLISNGKVLPEWLCNPGDNPVPWYTEGFASGGDPNFRLHKEICDFYEFVKPREHEQVVRELLLTRLQTAIKEHVAGCELRCFGSFAAGLYLPNADMDLVIVSHRFLRGGMPEVFQSYPQMRKLADHLLRSGIAAEGSVEVISKAKVPIVKFVDEVTRLKIDISFENSTGLVANQTFGKWKQQFPAMPILVTLIKQFLLMRGLNEVVNGGLGGFSITCLVTSLLQNLPRVQAGVIVPEQHLGEVLIEFLDLYGNLLDATTTGIQMDPPGYYPKPQSNRNSERLAIMDPNTPNNDISGGSHNVMLIFRLFSQARNIVKHAMASSEPGSLLSSMLGGDYSCYFERRDHLLRIYRDTYGPVLSNYSNGTAGGAFVEIAKVDYTSATTTKSVKVTLTEDVFAAPNLPSNISTKQNQQNAQQHAEKTGPGKIGKRKKQRIREALRLRKIANGGGPSRAEEAKAHKKKTKAKKKAKKKAKEHPVATASVNSAPIVNSVSASNSVPVIERKNKLSKTKSRALVASGNTTSNPITID